MSEEEKKAVEHLESMLNIYHYVTILEEKQLKENVKIILNLIECQQKELEGKDCVIEMQSHNEEVLNNELDKKNKEIEEYNKLKQDLVKVNKRIYDVEIIENMCNELAQLQSENKELHHELQHEEIEHNLIEYRNKLKELEEDYIPKSKIQEKIDELENEQDNLDNHHFIYSEYEMYRKIIFILEEFLEGEDEMNDCKVFIKLKDKTTGCISEEVPIDELIYNQNEIEFDFLDAIDEFGDIMDLSLPYNDFLFFQNDYEVIVKIKGEDE